VKEIKLARHPSSSYEEVFACDDCLKTSKRDRLIANAAKALQYGGFNEVELTEGDLKVHLVRFTPVPYYSAPNYSAPITHWPGY